VVDRCKVAESAKNAGLSKRSRTVLLSYIPPKTSVADICDQIRGGALEKVSFVRRSGVAFVSFLTHTSATSFFQRAVYRGLFINNTRLHAQFVPESPQLPSFLLEHIRLGASRCLGIVDANVLQASALLKECERYGTVERISISQPTSTVTFTHLLHAIKASRLLPSQEPYKGLQIVFIKDPCAAPYPADVEEAAALQAEIASLLVPPANDV